jgi:myo-inositol-1(or 4)-monophosphatase
MHPLLNVATQAAREASKIILQSLDHLDGRTVKEKQRNDFVTQVDELAQSIIIDAIKKNYPDHAILAEESVDSAGEGDYRWVIDPLDGTTNFIHGIPHFAVSIAAQEKGKTIIALVYDPVKDELFSAIKGQGATLNQRRLRVSDKRTLDTALLGTGFPFRNHELFKDYMQTFETLFLTSAGVRRQGAASLDLAYVAAGRLDGFWELQLEPWDIAAGALLVKEAGGMVIDAKGSDDYMKSGSVIAGNTKIVKGILQQINRSVTH